MPADEQHGRRGVGNTGTELRSELSQAVHIERSLTARAKDGDVAISVNSRNWVDNCAGIHEGTLGNDPLGTMATLEDTQLLHVEFGLPKLRLR